MRLSEFIEHEMRTAGVNDPFVLRALFLIKGQGYAVRDLFRGLGLKNVNPEVASSFILKRRGLSLDNVPKTPAEFAVQMKPRDKARHLEEMQSVSWANNLLSVVMDVTDTDYNRILALKAGMEAMGYDTSMVFIDTSATSEEDPEVPSSRYKTVFGTVDFIAVKSLRPDLSEVDRVKMTVRKRVQTWLGRPLTNPMGKAIVLSLRSIGGRNIADLNRALQM
jgi:hypothetical protein